MTEKNPARVKKPIPSWLVFVCAFVGIAILFAVGNILYLRHYWKNYDFHTTIDSRPTVVEGSFCASFQTASATGFLGASGSGFVVVDSGGRKIFSDTGKEDIRCLPLITEDLVPGSLILVAPERGGDVRIFDLKGGRPTVVLKFEGSFLATPQVVTLSDGSRFLLLSGGGGFIRLVSADGNVKWAYESGTDDALVPIVLEEARALFFCSTAGSAVRLNLETGQKEWQYDFEGQIISGPILIKSKSLQASIVFFADGGKAVVVDGSSGQVTKTLDLGESVNEGYAIVQKEGKRLIVLGAKGALLLLDPVTLAVEKKIEAGSAPIRYPVALTTDQSFVIAYTDFSRKINIVSADFKTTTLYHVTDLDSLPSLTRGDDGNIRLLLIDVKRRLCLMKTAIALPGTIIRYDRIISID